MVARDWSGEIGTVVIQKITKFVYKINKFWRSDVQHAVTIVNNTVIYTRKLLRVDFKYSCHT